MFSVIRGIAKKLLKTAQTRRKSLIAKSKLNRIESTISKALIDKEISHEDFTAIINEEKNYPELKESIRMIKSQRSIIESNKLIENDKRIGIAGIFPSTFVYHHFAEGLSFSKFSWGSRGLF